jgi:hypothetical protein
MVIIQSIVEDNFPKVLLEFTQNPTAGQEFLNEIRPLFITAYCAQAYTGTCRSTFTVRRF